MTIFMRKRWIRKYKMSSWESFSHSVFVLIFIMLQFWGKIMLHNIVKFNMLFNLDFTFISTLYALNLFFMLKENQWKFYKLFHLRSVYSFSIPIFLSLSIMNKNLWTSKNGFSPMENKKGFSFLINLFCLPLVFGKRKNKRKSFVFWKMIMKNSS